MSPGPYPPRHGSLGCSRTLLRRPEQRLFCRPPEQPLPILLAQEIEPVAHEGDAVEIAVRDDLEGAVALPQAAAGAERLDDAADQRGEVEVGRSLLAERVEGADLH